MTTLITLPRTTVEQALEALEDAKALLNNKDRTTTMWFADEITALRAALAQQAEPNVEYERGFIDGMQMQTKSSVDKAVNRMAEQAMLGVWQDVPGAVNFGIKKISFDEAMRLKDQMPKGLFRRVDGQAADEIWLCAIEVAERHHGITDPQIEDRLARHGIPMPEGNPK